VPVVWHCPRGTRPGASHALSLSYIFLVLSSLCYDHGIWGLSCSARTVRRVFGFGVLAVLWMLATLFVAIPVEVWWLWQDRKWEQLKLLAILGNVVSILLPRYIVRLSNSAPRGEFR
jgi:phosphoglycerol transferase MdoB-like AlkP superfamily enzyme